MKGQQILSFESVAEILHLQKSVHRKLVSLAFKEIPISKANSKKLGETRGHLFKVSKTRFPSSLKGQGYGEQIIDAT